jgi:hypothetical protein
MLLWRSRYAEDQAEPERALTAPRRPYAALKTAIGKLASYNMAAICRRRPGLDDMTEYRPRGGLPVLGIAAPGGLLNQLAASGDAQEATE